MTDPDRPTPPRNGDGPADNGGSGPEEHSPAAPRDPTAGRAGESSGVESPGGSTGADPDALDQSVGRRDAGQGDARTRDGAI